MLANEENKLSYIKHLMFREELLNMLKRDFYLDSTKPFDYEMSIISGKPPVISSEIIETYTCYPIDSACFQLKVRNLMIEQDFLNKIYIVSTINFPQNLSWPIIKNEYEQQNKIMPCFTGNLPSKWNLALIIKDEQYQFTTNYIQAYREDYHGKTNEIVQISDFDLYRIIEYHTNLFNSFEVNLDYCDEIKWSGDTKAQYSLKKDKNNIYQIF